MMAIFSNPRTDERITVRATVSHVRDITDLRGTRSEYTFRPELIQVEFMRSDGGDWHLIAPKISGPVIKKNGEPGERIAKMWQTAAFPQWALDFIESQRPVGGDV